MWAGNELFHLCTTDDKEKRDARLLSTLPSVLFFRLGSRREKDQLCLDGENFNKLASINMIYETSFPRKLVREN